MFFPSMNAVKEARHRVGRRPRRTWIERLTGYLHPRTLHQSTVDSVSQFDCTEATTRVHVNDRRETGGVFDECTDPRTGPRALTATSVKSRRLLGHSVRLRARRGVGGTFLQRSEESLRVRADLSQHRTTALAAL
jgi:hypothetical protein